ncbi:MMACHC-like protein [Toxocara canis]|uniref:Cyanocobalamin reductase (cyanide-eliminating) n=1 Tax=Toxocara canis TaxID=6265 RepID=A0A0B2VLZ9_TOXCA|nr:MMACHC-like protein [Toxocara canis]
MEVADKVLSDLCELLPETDGFECHRFKVGSYNKLVAADFQLPFAEDVMAVVVLNTPSFFETTFKRWLQSQATGGKGLNELIERFGANPMQAYFLEKFERVKRDLLPVKAHVIQDFDFTKSRIPKVLLTTCGMVSGAAYFYRPSENAPYIIDPVTHVQKRRMGLSLHPKFGGHFGFRAVYIFPEIHLPAEFKERTAPMVLKTAEKHKEALNLFNYHWKDGRFRDCGDPVERYSDLQLKFFSTPPMARWQLIAHWFDANRSNTSN